MRVCDDVLVVDSLLLYARRVRMYACMHVCIWCLHLEEGVHDRVWACVLCACVCLRGVSVCVCVYVCVYVCTCV